VVPPDRTGRDATSEREVSERIIDAALDLLNHSGRDALSTRAVCTAAGVQAPTLYRVFGDKRGLLDAVAARGLDRYLAQKHALERSADPVEDLRRGWDLHVTFGLENPAVYSLIYGDPVPGRLPPAARQARTVLEGLVHRIAAAGRLAVPEAHAVQLIEAAGRGTTFTLLSIPPDDRDPQLSTSAREATIAFISTDRPASPPSSLPSAAVAVLARLDDTDALTPGERALLVELLERMATSDANAAPAQATPTQEASS
jgi:AcrR family transcriptional regulator